MMGPLECGACTACCRHTFIALRPPDRLGDFDYVMAPATPELAAGMPAEALLPIEQLKNAPPELLKAARDMNASHFVAGLAQSASGDCVYLENGKCSIYPRRPSACRTFDCRTLFLERSRNERRESIKSGTVPREVFEAARQRLRQPTTEG